MKKTSLFLIVLLGLFMSGCPDSSNVGGGGAGAGAGAGSGSSSSTSPATITLSAAPTTLLINGTSSLTAVAKDASGATLSGVSITFSFVSTIGGTLSKVTVTTDGSGQAVTTFTAGSVAGTVTVKASSGSIIGKDVPLTITGPTKITLAASSTALLVNQTSTLTATALDSAGAPVSNATITFSLTSSVGGSLSKTSVQTDSSGVATTVFTAGTSAGTVTVTASSGSVSAPVTVTIALAGPPATVSVTVTPSPIDLQATSIVEAVVKDASGILVSNGTTVAFSLRAPLLTGASLSAASVTTTNGKASVQFKSGTVTGSQIIEVTSGSAPPATASVVVDAQPFTISSVTAVPAALVLGPNVTSSIAATVRNKVGDPVADGKVINFSVSPSGIGTISPIATTVGGVATAAFISNTSGTATITATAAAPGTGTNTTTVTITAPATSSISFVSAVPNVIGLKGSGQPGQSTITFAVNDVNGQPVLDGTQVSFSLIKSPGGGETLGIETGATVNGQVFTTLLSGTVAGPVTILATVTGTTISTASGTVSIGGGVPSMTHFDLATTLFNLSGLEPDNHKNIQATLTAFLSDRFGNFNVLEGTSVSFVTEAGSVDRGNVTGSDGATTAIFRTQNPVPFDVAPRPGEASYTVCESGFPVDPLTGCTTVSGDRPLTFNPRDGWSTVIAYTKGEETFLDKDGNGIFTDRNIDSILGCPTAPTFPNPITCLDINGNGLIEDMVDLDADGIPGEPFDVNGDGMIATGECECEGNPDEPFSDISEPILDANDNGKRDSLTPVASLDEVFGQDELPIDTDKNGFFTPRNGRWDFNITIWKPITLVFSGFDQFISRIDPLKPFLPTSGAGFFPEFSLVNGGCMEFDVRVSDQRLHPLSAGTTITPSAENGELFGQKDSFTLDDIISTRPTTFKTTMCDSTVEGTEATTTLATFKVKIVWNHPSAENVSSSHAPVSLNFPVTFLPPINVVTTTLANATVGTAYDQIIAVDGGAPPFSCATASGSCTKSPYTVEVSSGALPAGLSSSSTTTATGIPAVRISGTPTMAGAFTFSLRVGDNNDSPSDKQEFKLTVAP